MRHLLSGLFITALLLSGCTGEKKQLKSYLWVASPSITDVKVTDNFWAPKIERNRVSTIPYVFGKCEETGRVDNFAIAGGLMKGQYKGERYNDSDVFKIMEGACYSLMQSPDPKLEQYVDSIVTLIAAAQEDDGYLYTTRTIDSVAVAPGAGRERWIDERVSHELYNVGHMYEAAAAHYMATGKRNFLDVALRNADLVYKEFGWGKREIAPGHQEIEIGLIKLFRITGDNRYLDLAQFFIDVRGKQGDYVGHQPGTRFEVYNDSVYLQMHKPVLQQTEAVGHAVRGAYMYTAMADLSEATGNPAYLEASMKLWNDVVRGKMYITGGIGSKEFGEAFGDPFELPNMTAYTETCASVAEVFWSHRLFRATGDAKYLDVLERTLYNGLISGIGMDGCNFYYTNPLESDGSFERAGWFDCSCCPGNVSRFMPSMQQYIYSVEQDAISVNLFIGSEFNTTIDGKNVLLKQDTEYPFDGKVKITLSSEAGAAKFKLLIRIPEWVGKEPFEGGLYKYITPENGKTAILVNGRKCPVHQKNGFAVIEKIWENGDVIEVSFPMNPRFIIARDEVRADSGRVALGMGPLVYCLEETDNGKVRSIKVNAGSKIEKEFYPSFYGGVNILKVNAVDAEGKNLLLTAVPYYSWANRNKGEMIVWMKTE